MSIFDTLQRRLANGMIVWRPVYHSDVGTFNSGFVRFFYCLGQFDRIDVAEDTFHRLRKIHPSFGSA